MQYLIAAALIMILLTTSDAKEEASSSKGANMDNVQHRVLAFNLEGLTDKGAKKWDINGQSAEAVSENEIKLDNIVAHAYGDEAEATITADKGLYNKSENNVRLEQNVKATIENTGNFAKDYVGFADEISSQPKNHPQDAGSGTAGQTAGYEKPKKTKTVITCDAEVQFDYEKNQAYFNKNVKVQSDDGEINADKITIYLDPSTKRINQMLAEGSVKIIRGENVTYSERAIYIEAEKKIVLTGRPRLVIYREGGLEENFFGGDEEKRENKGK